MKNLLRVMLLIFSLIAFVGLSFTESVSASIFDNSNEAPYCNDGECGLKEGIDHVKGTVDGAVTDRKFSEWIQDVVKYVLSFLTLIAVLYIIYAGFNLLLGNGDEEKLKKTKSIIIYVIIGIVIIWLAYPIVSWLFSVLG